MLFSIFASGAVKLSTAGSANSGCGDPGVYVGAKRFVFGLRLGLDQIVVPDRPHADHGLVDGGRAIRPSLVGHACVNFANHSTQSGGLGVAEGFQIV